MTPEQAEQLFAATDAFLRQNALDDAESAARELVHTFESPDGIVPETERVNYGMALGVLAKIALKRTSAQAAVNVFTDALERMPFAPSVRRAVVFLNSARLFKCIGQYGYSADTALRAVSDVANDAHKLESRALEVVFEALTILRNVGGHTEAAVTVLQAALSTAQSAETKESSLIVRLHKALKDVLLATGRYQDAQPHAEFMIAVVAARYGAESAEVGDAYVDYGLTLDQSGRYRDAKHHYRTALRILWRHRGPLHPSVMLVRRNLAEIAPMCGD